MSHANKGNKPKSARAQRAEFDRVLQTLENESRAYQTPSSQKLTFAGAAGWVALAPIYLYASGIFETSVKENVIIFALGALAAGLILFHLYDMLATQKKNVLLAQLRQAAFAEGKETIVDKSVVSRAGYYALFVVNFLYLAFFLLNIAYFLPTYELSHPINFSLSSLFSAGVVAALVSSRLL